MKTSFEKFIQLLGYIYLTVATVFLLIMLVAVFVKFIIPAFSI